MDPNAHSLPTEVPEIDGSKPKSSKSKCHHFSKEFLVHEFYRQKSEFLERIFRDQMMTEEHHFSKIDLK